MAAAAGKYAMARLSANHEGNAMVTIGDSAPEQVMPPSKALTFKPSRRQPIFYGASETGSLVAVHCRVISGNIVTYAHTVLGVSVQSVNAASGLCVLFTCTQHRVWLINLAEPTALVPVGRVDPGAVLVAAFASPAVAVVATKHPSKTLELVVIAALPWSRATWGSLPEPTTLLNPPVWAACCACNLRSGIVTAYVAGSLIVAAQKKAVPLQVRSKFVISSRTSTVCSIAASDGCLLCLLADGKLVRIAADNQAVVIGTARALTDSGHTC